MMRPLISPAELAISRRCGQRLDPEARANVLTLTPELIKRQSPMGYCSMSEPEASTAPETIPNLITI